MEAVEKIKAEIEAWEATVQRLEGQLRAMKDEQLERMTSGYVLGATYTDKQQAADRATIRKTEDELEDARQRLEAARRAGPVIEGRSYSVILDKQAEEVRAIEPTLREAVEEFRKCYEALHKAGEKVVEVLNSYYKARSRFRSSWTQAKAAGHADTNHADAALWDRDVLSEPVREVRFPGWRPPAGKFDNPSVLGYEMVERKK